MGSLYLKTINILFWKVKETKWIVATAAVIIVMVSMVFSVSDNITTSYQKTIGDMILPFDVIVACETDEEMKQVLSLATQQDKDILSTVSTGNFDFGIAECDFNLNVLGASESLVEMYNIDVIEGTFPQNTDEIMLDSKINQVSGKEYKIGDFIRVETVEENGIEIKELEFKVVGFFNTVHGSGLTLYGYMNEEAGIQLSSLLQVQSGRQVILKLSQCSLETVDDLWESFKPQFEDKISINVAKYNVLYEEESSSIICQVFSNLGLVVVVISALLFNGIFRLNILNVQKRIGLLRCMGLGRKQLIVSLGLCWLCFLGGYITFSLPMYILCTNLFGPTFFQNAIKGYYWSDEVSMVWSFGMRPYLYSLFSVILVTTLVYGKLLYNVLKEKPLKLIKGGEKIKVSKGKRKKEKRVVVLIGKRNLLRSKSRTVVLGFVFFVMSCLLLVSVVTAVTIDFTELDALKRGKAFDYEFYTDYSDESRIDTKLLGKIEELSSVDGVHKGVIRFADYFRTDQIKDVNEDSVGIIVYSEEMLSMTCKEAGIVYENVLEKPRYYIFTKEAIEQDKVTIWDAKGKQKELPLSGKIVDAVYSYYKVGEEGFKIITNEAGAKELFGEVQYNCFFVKANDRTNALEQINRILEENEYPVYYNDLKEFNNAALEELDSMLFMVAYIAVCIGFMVMVNIACNITINIITRQQELGILAAMGMTKSKIIHLLIYEITTVLGDGIIWSLPISILLCTMFGMGTGQECNYVKMLLAALVCVVGMYAVCYLICYLVGHYLLKKNITRVLSEE